MVTDHEMRMYALDLFEVLRAIDHTLTVHGHVDAGTPLHQRITNALDLPRADAEQLRRHQADAHSATMPNSGFDSRDGGQSVKCSWCGGNLAQTSGQR